MEEQKATDGLDKRIRIFSGALIGILVGIFGGLAVFGPSPLVFVLGTALTFVFALLAVRFRDTFWLRLSRALRRMSWLS
jgi:hypothetical protein